MKSQPHRHKETNSYAISAIQFTKPRCDSCDVSLLLGNSSYTGIPVEIDEGHIDWLCDDCADPYLCHEQLDGGEETNGKKPPFLDDPNNWTGCGNHTVDPDTGVCRICNTERNKPTAYEHWCRRAEHPQQRNQ